MSILIGFLYVVEVIVCLLLGLVVMLQKPKEGGLGGLAGGMGEAVFGADAGNVLIKATIWLGSIFLVNTLLLARLTSTRDNGDLMKDEAAPIEQQAPIPAGDVGVPAQMPAQGAAPIAPAAPADTAAPAPAPVTAAPTPAPVKPAAPVKAPEDPAAPAKK